MKTYLRLLSFARPVQQYALPFFIFSLLASIFGILNFTLLIPLLDVLFDQVGGNKMVSYQRPEASFSIDYLAQSFNYYFNTTVRDFGRLRALQAVCGTIVLSVFLANVCKYFSARILERFKANMVARLRQSVFDNAIRLHLGFFSNQRKGDLMSRLVTDIQEVEASIAGSFSAAFKEVFTLFVYLFALFKISTTLTLFAFLIIPTSGIFIATIVKKMRQQAIEGQERLSKIISVMDEAFGGMRVVKGFNAEAFISERFGSENEGYRRAIRALANKREMASPFSEFMGVTLVAVILLYGGSLVLAGQSELTASQFIFYIATFSQVMRPAKEISNAFSQTQRGLASGDRILSLLDTQPAIQDASNAEAINSFESEVKFQDVSFAYVNDLPVLQDITFTMAKGQTIALVGSSGGGKSTIADLVPRFYDPTHGSILIDGLDLRHIKQKSLRGLMGIVTQEPILFNDTILNNIAFGSQASPEAVEAAAKIANAHDFIMAQTDGYQTVIGDRGSKLSGGQRQRLSIARAVLKNPPILILDEATSALDTESEKLVQEALTNLMKNRTTLVIAHRLSTIQHADVILVIHQGRIIERGTHHQLLELEDGFYKKLSSMQQA